MVQVDDHVPARVREERPQVEGRAGREASQRLPPEPGPALPRVGRLQVHALFRRVGGGEPDAVGVVERPRVVPRPGECRQPEVGERGGGRFPAIGLADVSGDRVGLGLGARRCGRTARSRATISLDRTA